MKYKLVTIKEYIEEHADKKKSQIYNDVESGKLKSVVKFGRRLIRVKV